QRDIIDAQESKHEVKSQKCSFGMEEGKILGYIVTSEGIRENPEKKAVMNMPSPSKLKQMQRISSKLTALNIFLSKAAKRALSCLDTLKNNKKDFYWMTEAEEAFQAIKKLIAELPTLTTSKKEKEIMVYQSAANKIVSAVLLVERDGRKTPIHYVIRTLQGAEINYPPMEKLALELVHAARRLRRYFQGHTIKVITDKLISQILSNREATAKIDGSDDTLTEGENLEEQEATETQAPANLKAETDICKLYADGVSNKHGSRVGFRIATKIKVKNACICRFGIGSKPGGRTVRGKRKADALSKLEAVQCEGLTKGVLIEELNERSMDATEVNAIIEEAIRTWMTPIQEYIKKESYRKMPSKHEHFEKRLILSRSFYLTNGYLRWQSPALGLTDGTCSTMDNQDQGIRRAIKD
nr:hypothetical protein [Tanacetum cinerariifolium]